MRATPHATSVSSAANAIRRFVECAVEDGLGVLREAHQPGGRFLIDAIAGKQRAEHDAVRAGRQHLGRVGEQLLRLGVVVREVTAPRTRHGNARDAEREARAQQVARRGDSADGEISAHLQPPGALAHCALGVRERVDGGLDQDHNESSPAGYAAFRATRHNPCCPVRLSVCSVVCRYVVATAVFGLNTNAKMTKMTNAPAIGTSQMCVQSCVAAAPAAPAVSNLFTTAPDAHAPMK